MGFMKQEITRKIEWWEVETTCGSWYVPKKNARKDQLSYMCEGDIESVSTRFGYGARLSAPGYLDCTDWDVFDTQKEAQEFLDKYEEIE